MMRQHIMTVEQAEECNVRCKGEKIDVLDFDNLADFTSHMQGRIDAGDFEPGSGAYHDFPWQGPLTGRGARQYNGSQGWDGGITGKKLWKMMQEGGNEALASDFRKYTDALPDPDIEGRGVGVAMTPSGGVPVIPAVLAGHPECMLTIAEQDNNRSPIGVHVYMGAQAGVDAAAMSTRGAAILALVDRLALMRPVELFAYHCMPYWYGKRSADVDAPSNRMYRIRINTAPLSLAEAGLLLCSPSFVRHAIFGLEHADQCEITAPFGHRGCRDASIEAVCDRTPTDVVVGRVNSNQEIINDPVEWVRKRYMHALELIATD